jgi:hypothetical protein
MLLNFDIFSYQLYVAEHNIVHVYTAELNILLADHSYGLSKDISILSKLGRVILLISGFFLQWHCQCGSSKAGKSKGYRVDRISCCLVPPYDVPIARFCGAMSSHSVLERLLLFVNMWLDLRFR